MGYIEIEVDGRILKIKEGQTLLQIIRKAGGFLPTWCSAAPNRGSSACRLCMVRVEGSTNLVSACDTQALNGMQVRVGDPDLIDTRKTIMEMILSDHGPCTDPYCKVEELAKSLGVSKPRFRPSIQSEDLASINFGYIGYNQSICVHCDRCIEICQKPGAIERTGRNQKPGVQITTHGSKTTSKCTGCGDCVATCLSGALFLTD
jgi:predicted molibdopterin-dependent oxidoreductase YjgC